MLTMTLSRLLLVLPLYFSAALADCARLTPNDLTSNKWEQQKPNLDFINPPPDNDHYKFQHEYTFGHQSLGRTHHTPLKFTATVLKSTAQGLRGHRTIELTNEMTNDNWEWRGRPFRIQFIMHTGHKGDATADYWIKSMDSCTLEGYGNDGYGKIPFFAEDIKEVILWKKV